MTQASLAERVGKKPQYISRILNESTHRNLTIKTMVDLSCALNQTLVLRMLPAGAKVAVDLARSEPEVRTKRRRTG